MEMWIILFCIFWGLQDKPPRTQEKLIAKIQAVGFKRLKWVDFKDKIASKKGAHYKEEVLNEDIKRLFATGKFLDVRAKVKPLKDDPNLVEITFFVRELEKISKVRFQGQKSRSVKNRIEGRLRLKEGIFLDITS
jgi:outer membrane protein assembly factor BamA